MSDPTGHVGGDRLGRIALALAIAAALLLALVDVGAPWEDGLRGENAAIYEDVFVRNFLRYGLEITHGAPAYVYEVDGRPVCTWHWHHPAAYPLYLTSAAALFGHSEPVLRLAHLVLFLPGIAALWWLLARAIGERFAGLSALLFALSPMVSYFGPMVVHDGAVMAFGLASAASFWAACEHPSRTGTARTLLLFLVTTQLDFLGHFWGLAMFVLAFAAPDRRRALRLVAFAFAVSLASLLLVCLHYATIFGSPIGYFRMMLDASQQANARIPSTNELANAAREVMLDYGAWPTWAACAAGLLALPFARALPRARTALVGLALVLPGALASLLSLRHLVDHAFWSMPTTAGAAVFAAVVPSRAFLAGSRMPRAGLRNAVLAALTAAVLVHGAATTLALIARFRPAHGSFQSLVQEATHHLGGVALALTNRDVPMRPFLPGLLFLGNVRTGADLDQWLAYGRSQGIAAELAFVLDLEAADPSLVERLDRLAVPMRTARVAVYRFRS